MKRLLFVFVAAIVAASFVATIVLAAVSNGDFETGTFGSWTKSTFINAGLSAAHGAGGADLSAIVGGPAAAPLSSSDPNTSGALLFPAYGHYSARVNSEASHSGAGNGQNGNTIVQTVSAYVDPSDGLSHVRFTYAAVMVEPGSGHTSDQKPYFRVRAVNQSNGNDVLYDFSSYVNEPGKNWLAGPAFSGGGTWAYLPWNYVDLASGPGHPVNAGNNIMIQIDASGCALGGHPGYAYVDEITDGDIAGPVVKATGPASVVTGGSITYTYNYKNGSGSTVNPTITATQPAGVTFNSVSDNVNCSLAGGTATCNFTGVAPGASGSFTVTGTVTAASGAQVSHGNYNIAAAGFPTIGGQTVSSNVAAAVVGTTTTVASGTNPSVYGQPVTFTATVTQASGVVTPTGNLQFVVDGSNFGVPQALSVGGTASVNTSALSVGGSHTVTAQYLGSAGFSASNGSLAGGQTVNKANTTVTLGSSVNPSVSGQPVTITATVAPAAPGAGTPTGTITIYVDGIAVCTNVPLSGNQATCSFPPVGPGNHVVTATYNGDGNFNTGNGTLAGGQGVNKANSAVTVTSSPNPTVAGQSFTATAVVSAVAPGTGTPTGTVNLLLDGNVICSNVTLVAASASCVMTANPGNHVITAQYGGDSRFNVSNGTLAGGQNVGKANTSVGVTSSTNPSVSGQPFTATALVSPVAPGTGTPTGTVTLLLDGNAVCSNVTLVAASASCMMSATPGNHVITAQYGGDTNFNVSNGSLAGGQNVGKANTSVAVSSSANPTVSGQNFTATAVVSPVAPGTGTPTGTVTLLLDGNAVCSNVTMVAASASCVMSATPGNHVITAQYGGDSSFNVSNGTLAGGQNVGKANTSVAVSSSSNPSVAGQPVTFTATVSPVAPGSGTPTGTIQFVIDGTNFGGPVTMSGGSAQMTTSVLTDVNSPHLIGAQYGGNANFNGSNGAASQNVTPSGDFSISMTDGVTTAPAGSTVTYSIVVSNAGPSSVSGATVFDTLPTAIAYASWTCTASAGGNCGAASGFGGINQTIGLPVGGSATFTLTATIKPTATGTLTNTATVGVPAGTTDPFPGNNSASDTDTLTGPSVFVIDDVRLAEGNVGTTAFVFTVSKLGATGFPTAVAYHTVDGTATVADGDYQETSGTVNFGPNDTTQTITVLVNGDVRVEGDELFTLHLLGNAVNALIQDADGIGKIVNDDAAATPTPTPNPTPTPRFADRFEGDINRTIAGFAGVGDSDVTVGDQIQYQRFLSGADCPDMASGEQQRLDAGPRATLGDGLIGSADGAAIDAYARHDSLSDFDPNVANWQPTPAGGPTEITNLGCAQTPGAHGDNATVAQPEPEAATAARMVQVVPTSAVGRDITVEIEMAAQGNEAGTQFSLHFDPTVVGISSVSGVNSNPDIALGADALPGTTLDVNAEDAVNGNIGIVENFNGSSDSITALPEGARRIARVTFHVRSGAAAGESKVTFGDDIVKGTSADTYGITLGTSFDQNGSVTIPATSGVTVSGRVMSPDGRGVRNATVTIVDHSGIARTVTTSSFGYYSFDEVATGESYRLTVSSRLYRFASRSVDITDSLSNVDFTGQE